MFRPIAHSGIHFVPGSKERRVSLIHVADLVELLLLAAGKGERLRPDGAPGQGFYFVAAEHDPTYAELGQAIAGAMGKRRATVVHMPEPLLRLVGHCGDALGRVRQRPGWVNSDKMAEALRGHGCAHPQRPVRGWIGPPRSRGPNVCAKRPDGIARPDGSEPRVRGSCAGPTAGAPVSVRREFSRKGKNRRLKPGPGCAQHGTATRSTATCCLVANVAYRMPRHQSQLRPRARPRSPRSRARRSTQMAEKTANAAWREGQAFPGLSIAMRGR